MVATIVCPQCRHQNPDDAEFCEQCGAELPVHVANASNSNVANQVANVPSQAQVQEPEDQLVCPKCKAPYVPGDVFCFNCGTDLRGLPGNQPAVATPAPVAQPQPVAVPVENQVAPATPPVNPASPQPAADTGMSPDDWDKAFENPGTPLAVNAPATPVVAAPPAVQPPVNQPAANGFPVPSPVSFPAAVVNPVQSGTPGSSNQLVLNVNGPYGMQTVEYNGRELLLGRTDAKTRVYPDVNLDDSAASRRHASIWLEEQDGQFYVQDLESSNGTSLNGNELEQGSPVKLSNGDILKIGTRYSIQVHIS